LTIRDPTFRDSDPGDRGPGGPAQVDGLVVCDDTSTGSFWPAAAAARTSRAFENTDNAHDGLDRLSPEWIARNMPS